MDDRIAFAGSFFQCSAILDRNDPSTVVDVAGQLERSRHSADHGATDAEHFTEELLCQGKRAVPTAIVTREKPAGGAVLHGMHGVAGNRLKDLRDEGLDVV